MNEILFQEFPKMARYSRECIITEKIDGTNAQIYIVPTTELSAGSDYPNVTHIEDFSQPGSVAIFVGSRNRWITPGKGTDNAGFAGWVEANAEELKKLGPGRHFGEWWGGNIQRGYGRKEKVFSLFNVNRWTPMTIASENGVYNNETLQPINCCRTVPILARGDFRSGLVTAVMDQLKTEGSRAEPGYMNPEGIVIFHCAAQIGFKKTLLNDEAPKSRPGLTNPAQLIAGVEAAQEVFKQQIQNENPQTSQ